MFSRVKNRQQCIGLALCWCFEEVWFRSVFEHAFPFETFGEALVINVDVDDELVAAGSCEEGSWFLRQLEAVYRLTVEGPPFPFGERGDHEHMSFLKKTYIFVKDGIIVFPKSKYISGIVNFSTCKTARAKRRQSTIF